MKKLKDKRKSDEKRAKAWKSATRQPFSYSVDKSLYPKRANLRYIEQAYFRALYPTFGRFFFLSPLVLRTDKNKSKENVRHFFFQQYVATES